MNIEHVAATIKDCRFCWMCRHVCPVARETANETNTPRGKALTLWTVLARMTDFQDTGIVQTMYECALCENCKAACVTGRDMPAVILAARAAIVDQGQVPLAVRETAEAIIDSNNPWGKSRDQVEARLKEEIQALPPAAEVLLYLGCTSTYMQPEIALAAIKILQQAGVDFTMLAEEGCCGLPLWRLGYQEAAHRKAAASLELIKKSNCQTIVTLCSSCYSAFREEYQNWDPGLAPGARVLHSSEFLAELLRQGTLKPRTGISRTVTFHDPCILARKSGQQEVPRQILAMIPELKLVEMQWNRRDTHCCGSSLLHRLYPELAGKIAVTRAKEARETGADLVVTTCPGCKRNLGKAGEMEVLELNELLAQTI